MGYRWYDTKDVKPLFAFGHGLSYTTFEYGEAKIKGRKLSVAVKIEGSAVSKETFNADKAAIMKKIAELNNIMSKKDYSSWLNYIAADSKKYWSDNYTLAKASEKLPKELKGFKKVFLQPGERKTVTFDIPDEALSFFDADAHKWVAEPGEFIAHVGSASDDIRSSVNFKL